ncbi:hypothetical protein PXJ20_00010 [Paraburkholderia sp. A1RI_3L]|uniref:helix-turn-helix transcriptional regulator n=1 Tax=Paraburkholderia TaxID=1822464 RepID=UPI003B7DD497
MSTTPFTPITKENAAHILSVSVRTVDHYVQDGRMPAPVHLGRRAYWHPDVFYGWLHQALGIPCARTDVAEQNAPAATTQPAEAAIRTVLPRPAATVSRKPQKSGQTSAGRSLLTTRVQERDSALLAALNS